MRHGTALLVVFCVVLLLPATSHGDSLNEELGIEPSPATKIERSAMDGMPSEFLMIPDSTNDVVGMYDPYDGTYIGDIITGFAGFSTPINAVLGPDGNIYVSDQIADSINVFDTAGTHLYTYADDSDGLNNVRGIDFRDGHLFVTSGDDYVAEFDGPHSRLADFIADGSDPFDILFLDDGRALLTDIAGTTDNVRLYDAGGALVGEIFAINFPEQVQTDSEAPGDYLNLAFSGDQVTDFDLDGTLHNTQFFNSGRGVYRLGNGNLLLTAGDGVWEMDPATGTLLENKNPDASARFIELAMLGESPTAAAALTCLPDSGTLPFSVDICVEIENLTKVDRTYNGVIDVTTGGGGVISGWRSGTLNLAGGEVYTNCWDFYMGPWNGLVGANTGVLTVIDVTPTNGGTAVTDECTVTGLAD